MESYTNEHVLPAQGGCQGTRDHRKAKDLLSGALCKLGLVLPLEGLCGVSLILHSRASPAYSFLKGGKGFYYPS